MNKPKTKLCDECGSKYNSQSSRMYSLCPECSNILYGYEKCNHNFVNGKCSKCLWDNSASDFVKTLKIID